MRFFSYIFIVAVVSQIKETFQAGSSKVNVDKFMKNDFQVIKLFRDDALYVVQGIVVPLIENTLLMAQGVSCFPIVRNDENLPVLNLILASMSIAWEHPFTYHEMIRDAADGRKAASSLPQTLMNNIKTIVRTCLLAENDFKLGNLEPAYEHLLDFKPDTKIFPKIKYFQWDFKSAKYCYELLVGIDYEPNKLIFGKFIEAFSIVSRRMQRSVQVIQGNISGLKNEDFPGEKDEIMNLVCDIDTSTLQFTPNTHSRKEEYKKFSELMEFRNNESFDKKIAEPIQKAVMFIKIAGFLYAVNGIRWSIEYFDNIMKCMKTCGRNN